MPHGGEPPLPTYRPTASSAPSITPRPTTTRPTSTGSSDLPTEEVTTMTTSTLPSTVGSSRHQPLWPSPTPPMGLPTEWPTTSSPTTYPPKTESPTTESPTTKSPTTMLFVVGNDMRQECASGHGGPVRLRRFIFVHSVLTRRDVMGAFNCVIQCLLQTRDSHIARAL